jgi:uncharacterized protein YydD (DUF2326 family)
MKLSQLYTNKEEIFPTIRFLEGFNVVFARVKNPLRKDKDSHNLGKTFLADVIDYCFLSDLPKDHAFKGNSDLFKDFIFFLEVKTNNNTFVTIRRKVFGKKSINIHISSESMNLVELPESEWQHTNLGLDEGVSQLNEIFNLDVIKPYNYRKGITYFLRRQADYNDVFLISKFSAGKHKDWKPYMAQVLGLNQTLVQAKYEIDDEIAEKEKDKARISKKAGARARRYDEIKGLIEIKQSSVRRLQKQLDGFSFYGLESEINDDIVRRIEQLISEYNQERYTIDYELQEIENSLKSDYVIDVKKMLEVFQEVELVMPNSLTQEYEQLVDFNKRLSVDRAKRLDELKKKLNQRRIEIESALKELDNERQKALELLKQKETFQKYKGLQRELLDVEEEILHLQQQLTQLDEVTSIEHQIENLEQDRTQIIHQLEESLRQENSVYTQIRGMFAEYVEDVLSAPASLYTEINSSGNLDFKARIVDRILGQETHQWKGTSYKKILCACFDLTNLSAYHEVNFYRFVYHDGVFEGLDNRKKVNLLKLIRRLCNEQGIQYILTVIDSDLPRDEKDNKLMFGEDEIIRSLHDDGDDGRLFRMPIF